MSMHHSSLWSRRGCTTTSWTKLLAGTLLRATIGAKVPIRCANIVFPALLGAVFPILTPQACHRLTEIHSNAPVIDEDAIHLKIRLFTRFAVFQLNKTVAQ